jgi:hypothetical protein
MGGGTAYIVCSGVDECFRAIQAAGVRRTSAFSDRLCGMRGLITHDPDGNQLSFDGAGNIYCSRCLFTIRFCRVGFASAGLPGLAVTRLEDHVWTSSTHHSGLCGVHRC